LCLFIININEHGFPHFLIRTQFPCRLARNSVTIGSSEELVDACRQYSGNDSLEIRTSVKPKTMASPQRRNFWKYFCINNKHSVGGQKDKEVEVFYESKN
jgi:vesicle coat complex subunit